MKESSQLFKRLGIVLFLALAILVPTQLEAQDGKWLNGQTIRIMIGYPPGGGHDLEARVIGRHLRKYLPGNPGIIVQNLPGAGGMIQAAFVYNRAKPDGLTIGLFGNSHSTNALLRTGDELKYDMGQMPIIWAVGGVDVDMVRDFLGVKTGKDLVKIDPSQIVVAGRSKGGSSCTQGQLALELIEIKGFKAVCAYGGTAVIRGAMERGEVSFFNGSDAHLVGNGAFVDVYKRGLVYPIWQSGILKEDGTIIRSPTVREDVPTLFEVYREIYGKAPSGNAWEAWKALTLGLALMNRALVLPPGTPEDRVTILRNGIMRMAKDPKFVADWERVFGQKLAPVLVDPAEATRVKDQYLKTAPWQGWLRKFVWG